VKQNPGCQSFLASQTVPHKAYFVLLGFGSDKAITFVICSLLAVRGRIRSRGKS
jgi:hypothetical protein